MNIPARLHYFFSPPPLWIIQLGKDQLIFSRVTKQGITDQEQLYLDSYTILANKIANPSSLCHGLRSFCKQKKLSKIRAWFLLPREFFPDTLLPHELFQFLISIKNSPVIPEGVITNPFATTTQLMHNALPSIIKADNYMTMFAHYNQLHPGWWLLGSATTALSVCLASNIILQPQCKVPQNIEPNTRQTARALTPNKISTNAQRGTIADTTAILTTIAATIPPTIVLERLAAPSSTARQTSTATTIAGITSNLQDLTIFVTTLEQKLNRHCNLSHLKELPQKRIAPALQGKTFVIYHFALTIEA